MFLRRCPEANLRLDTSSLALLAKGVTTNATKNGLMPDACTPGWLLICKLRERVQWRSILVTRGVQCQSGASGFCFGRALQLQM